MYETGCHFLRHNTRGAREKLFRSDFVGAVFLCIKRGNIFIVMPPYTALSKAASGSSTESVTNKKNAPKIGPEPTLLSRSQVDALYSLLECKYGIISHCRISFCNVKPYHCFIYFFSCH